MVVLAELNSFYPDWNFEWFTLINSQWSGGFLDWLLPLLRNKYFWIPLYLFIASFLLLNYGRRGFWAIVFCAITFALSNTISAEIMKPAFKQDRPCQTEALKGQIVVRVNCGPGKSFPSAHATNHMAMAVFLGLIFWRKGRGAMALLVIWALSIGYAQIYVGVHYPVDVLVGFLLGAVSGLLVAAVYNKLIRL